MTISLEQRREDLENHGLVVDHQHIERLADRRHLIRLRDMHRRAARDRQLEYEGAALTQLALDAQRAPVIAHDAVAHGQSQTGSATHRLGGEERVEDTLL